MRQLEEAGSFNKKADRAYGLGMVRAFFWSTGNLGGTYAVTAYCKGKAWLKREGSVVAISFSNIRLALSSYYRL